MGILEDFYKNKESESVEIVDDDENSDDNKTINMEKENTPRKSSETINREKENTPRKSITPPPSTSQRIDTLKSNINALTWVSWLLDSHIDLAVEDIQEYEKIMVKAHCTICPLSPISLKYLPRRSLR